MLKFLMNCLFFGVLFNAGVVRGINVLHPISMNFTASIESKPQILIEMTSLGRKVVEVSKLITKKNRTATNTSLVKSRRPTILTSDNRAQNVTLRENANRERQEQIASAREFLKKIGVKEEYNKPSGNAPGPKVLGGVISNRGQWPWQALVKSTGGFCGGVLIHSCYVLTARHCTQGYNRNQIRVILGELDRSTNEGFEQQRNVLHIFEHPNFDAAILLLDRAISMGSVYKVDKIPIAASIPSDGTQVTVSGWGWVNHQGFNQLNKLRHADLPIVNWNTCASVMNPVLNSPLDANNICVRSPSIANACHGDSGGPLVYKNGNTWELIGIVNRGVPNCPSHVDYAVCLSVPSIQEWISGIVPAVSTTGGQPCNCLHPVRKFDNTNIPAHYDWANCHIGPAFPGCNEPDQGNKFFVYANQYYIASHKANECPVGTWDKCKCHIRELSYDPPEFRDFIIQNAFYTIDFPEGNCLPGFTHDTVNCHFMSAPWGTIASKSNHAWYTTARPTCDAGMGTSFDGTNCFWRPKPADGYIHQNAYYRQAGPGNTCPEGTWDGHACYLRPAPFGTTAFESDGNWSHTPRRTCDDGAFDGANCKYGAPPQGSTAFIWNNNYYYGWF